MGLDMYLGQKGKIDQYGYWRKANQIHSWFVNNCADGEDDCQPIKVTREDLKRLDETIDEVLANSKLVDGKVVQSFTMGKTGIDGKADWIPNYIEGKVVADSSTASELLPTTEGFFFGSQEYDQWYIEDLKLTKKIIKKALADDKQTYIYEASW